MAASLLERYPNAIKIATADAQIYKDESVYDFDTPVSTILIGLVDGQLAGRLPAIALDAD